MNGEIVKLERADVAMDAIFSEFKQKSAEERAFILIRRFWDAMEPKWDTGEEISEEMATNFREWFCDPRNRMAKDEAMDRMLRIAENDLRELGMSDQSQHGCHV